MSKNAPESKTKERKVLWRISLRSRNGKEHLRGKSEAAASLEMTASRLEILSLTQKLEMIASQS